MYESDGMARKPRMYMRRLTCASQHLPGGGAVRLCGLRTVDLRLFFWESPLKLMHPSPDDPVPDEDLEWTVRLSLECRRRVKEQQKRIGSAEFRNTQFSYTLGQDGVLNPVVTPELQSEHHIARDPLWPGQVWSISPGDQDEGSGLYRIEVNEDSGSGVKILNRPAPQAFTESVKYAEANLYSRAGELVGDRNPREHEFSVQLRAFDASKGGRSLGVASAVGPLLVADQQEPAGWLGCGRWD